MKRLQTLLYGAILLVAIFLTLGFPRWTADDAYITMRYAQNLAEHGELTFNVDANPVEGYTGILLPLLLAAAIYAGLSPVIIGQIIGVVAFAACLLLMQRFLTRLEINPWQRPATLLLFATSAMLYPHIFSGMETMLFTALLLFAFYQLFRLLEDKPTSHRQYIISAFLFLLPALCRPEGALFALLATLVTGYAAVQKRETQKWLPAFTLGLLLPGALYFFWRWSYYGYPLPNTFYAKLGGSDTAGTLVGFKAFLKQYLLLPAIIAILPFVTSVDESAAVLARQKKTTAALALAMLTIVLFIFIVMLHYARSTLEMNFSYRFYVPFYPLLLIQLNVILAPGLETIKRHRPSRPLSYNVVIMVSLLLLYIQTGRQVSLWFIHEKPIAKSYRAGLKEMHIAAGKDLNQIVPEPAWIVVYKDAGAIPYYAQRKIIDFGALNDEYLAHNPDLAISQRLDYLFSKNPAALAITSYSADSLYYNEETDTLLVRPEMQKYELKKIYKNSSGRQYYQFLYLHQRLENHKREQYPLRRKISGDGL